MKYFDREYILYMFERNERLAEAREEGIAIGMTEVIAEDIAELIAEGLAESREEGIAVSRAISMAIGMQEARIATAKRMRGVGMTDEQIHALTDLPIDIISSLNPKEGFKL